MSNSVDIILYSFLSVVTVFFAGLVLFVASGILYITF